MKVLTAKVLADGQLDVPEGTLQAGDVVTLLVPEVGDGFQLSAEEKSFLLESMAQSDRGEVVDGWQLLARIGEEP